jgi:hypothetical protein
MRKLIIAILILLSASLVAADTIKDLTEDTTPTSDDIVYTINNPSGSAADRKVTIGNLAKGMSSTNLSDSTNIIYESDGITPDGSGNFLITGDLRASLKIYAYSDATHTVTTAECQGTMHLNGGTAAIEFDLPDVVAGLNCCFAAGDVAQIITLDPNGTELILLDGVSQGAGTAVASSGAVGEFICLMGISTTEWLTLGQGGTWN